MSVPMDDEVVEFKSFNSNYISWLFSQPSSKQLYKSFLDENKEALFSSLKKMIKVTVTEDIVIELTGIFEYVSVFADIYNVFNANETQLSIKPENLEKLEKYNSGTSTKQELLSTISKFESESVITDMPPTNVDNTDLFSQVCNKYQDEEEDGGNCFQDIDFFKNIGNDNNFNEKVDNPFENYEYSDDDFGKLLNEGGNFSRKGSFI